MKILIDTSVIIAFANEEADKNMDVIERVFDSIKSRKIEALISSLTVAEIYASYCKRVQARKAAEIIIFLKEIGIKIIEVSEEIAKDGGILKAKYVSDLSYADAIIISTAVITGCDLLLTYDVEFFKVDEISVMKPENLSGK